jgi:hypothetical protein
MSERHESCYAILRFDGERIIRDVTVKEIVWDEDRARDEVDRLNKMYADKGCFYTLQLTRAEKREIKQ